MANGITRLRERGFTIVELAIVILVMLIILAIIVPSFHHLMIKAREDVLAEDLNSMRRVIDQYTADKEKAPSSLDDLVEAHYLREVPVDPITHEADWDVELEDEAVALDGERGIIDVHSKSDQVDSSGARRYNEW